jgi:hypothetical protein
MPITGAALVWVTPRKLVLAAFVPLVCVLPVVTVVGHVWQLP